MKGTERGILDELKALRLDVPRDLLSYELKSGLFPMGFYHRGTEKELLALKTGTWKWQLNWSM